MGLLFKGDMGTIGRDCPMKGRWLVTSFAFVIKQIL